MLYERFAQLPFVSDLPSFEKSCRQILNVIILQVRRNQEKVKAHAQKIGIEVVVMSLFLFLTLILLYPFSVLRMGTHLLGTQEGDVWQNLWGLWWTRESILSLRNPYYTNHIYYPYGTDLLMHTLCPLSGIVTIPVQLTMGLVFSYNLLAIVSFVIGCYGAYRLALYHTIDRKASFFSGLVFGFSTYHFAHLYGHMNLISIQWIPFYVLFLIKMRHQESSRNVLYAAIFLTLNCFMADLQYVVYLGLFTLFFLVYELVSNRKHIVVFSRSLIMMGALFFLFSSFMLIPLLYGWLTGKYDYATEGSRNFQVLWSADLLAFFLPSNLNPIFGRLYVGRGWIATILGGPENTLYIGYTVWALFAYAALKLRRNTRFFLITCLAFMILSLGPMLRVMGSTEFTVFNVNIPLPGILLYYIFPMLRVPSRLVLMSTLCFAIISAVSLKHITSLFSSSRNGKMISILFVSLISVAFLAEINNVPYPVIEDTSIPQFYYELAKKNGTFAILDLPLWYEAISRYMYYSTASGKPLVEGIISRPNPVNVQLLHSIPIVVQTNSILEVGEPIYANVILQNPNITNLNAFHHFGVRYIIVHKYYITGSAFTKLTQYLTSLIGQPIYSDERIDAYEVTVTELQGLFVFLLNGWWTPAEHWDGIPTVWMKKTGQIEVVSETPQTVCLRFHAYTWNKNPNAYTLVFLNNDFVGAFQACSTCFTPIVIPNLHLKIGTNTLSFQSNQTFVPAEVTESLDTRLLSIAIRNLELTKSIEKGQ